MKPRTIVTTVGTSILTSGCSPEERKKIISTANAKEEELTNDQLSFLSQKKKEKLQFLLDASNEELQKKSAELNGLLAIYNHSFYDNTKDYHILISTDTYQGGITGDIIKAILKQKGFNTVINYSPKKLSTKNKSDFIDGIKDLLHWLMKDDFKGYKEASREVIFNLTGGFKSLQGYLNTVGMFYADRLSYIFEGSSELIEIPKLPIKIDTDYLIDNAVKIALLSTEMTDFTNDEIAEIPPLMIEDMGSTTFNCLSHWGDLIWGEAKVAILSKDLLDFPYISYESTFLKDFNNIKSAKEKVEVQEALARASAILHHNKGDLTALKSDGGLQYSNYRGKPVDGLPTGHFRVNLSMRVSCVKKQDGKLHMRHYGTHDYIETREGL